jgi:hypothetical protein
MTLSHQIAIAQLDLMKKIQNFIDSKLTTDQEANRKDGFNLNAKPIEAQASNPSVMNDSSSTNMEPQKLKSADQGADRYNDQAGSISPAADPIVVNKSGAQK